MRKIFVFVILSALIFYTNAQNFNFGLKFNPAVSWFKVNNKDSIRNNGAGLSFSYGLTCDYNIAENYGINIEIMQVFFNASTVKQDVVRKYRLQNIEVPVSIKMITGYVNNFKYYGKFGIDPSLNTTSKTTKIHNSEDEISLMNFGIIIGAGIHYKLDGNSAAVAGITLHNFFIPDNKNHGSYELKPVYLSLDLGILF